MSSKHLSAGSDCPCKIGNVLRLYSMQFCPFCERVRMVLIMKNVAHDVVNVNLKNKPDWLLSLNPEGQVPVLDTGGDVISDSLKIVEYLEEKYPNPPLYSSDPKQRERDNHIMDLFGKVLGPFFSAIYDKENKSLDEYMNDMYNVMDPIEEELASRGTLFFGGDSPGFLDIMLWPWTERSKVPSILFNQPFNFPKERFNHLVEWRSAMKEQPVVLKCLIEPERHALLVQLHRKADKDGSAVDYESV